MAKVFDPQGNVREVPDDQLQSALSNGGKLAVQMKDPSGTMRFIPQDMVEQARQSGGTLVESKEATFWSNPREFLMNRASNLRQEAQHQVDQNVGVEGMRTQEQAQGVVGKGLAYAKRLGHGVAAIVPETAALVDSAAAGLMDWKSAGVMAAGAVDPAIPAAYFGTQGIADLTGIGGGKSSIKTAIENPTPENVQAPLVSGSMVAGGAGAAKAPNSGSIARGAVNVARQIPNAGRGMMADRMQKPVEPNGPTRAEVNDAARANNVNLDLAQATDHPVAKAVKKANRYSVASQGTYDSAAESNIDALSKWADKEASKYSDNGNREVAGQRTVAALKDDLTRKQESARTLYDGLDQRVGGVSQDVTGTIQSEAAKILAENKDYYAKHPELKPGKAWAIIEDLGSRSTKTAEAPMSTGGAEVLDSAGNPITKQVTQTVPKTASWSELHQLRSDLMEFYRNSPDIVKGRSEGWIQRMVGKIDESMTKAEGTMKPSDVADFRQANGIWKSIQETYNNPRSPYYQALKTAAPSQVPGMFASSPEFIRSLRQTISGLDGPVQRAFVEDNIINGKDGHIDLANMNSRLGRIPDAKLVEMVGAEGAKNLRVMGRVAAKIYADYKGSQTAERGVPMAEAVNLFANPVAGATELGAQYVGAKAINSPRVVDYLTEQRAAGRVPPKTGGVAGSEPVAPVNPETQPPTQSAPVRVNFDESGNIVDGDGRHRVIAALKRGDPYIEVQTKLRDGTVETLKVDPAKVAEKLGVTPESLKETDAQQAEFTKESPKMSPRAQEMKARVEEGNTPEPGKTGEMHVEKISQNPGRFQYKLNTDAAGVGTLLKEQTTFNPDLAGVITVWKDPIDGKTYVINGHHRLELAKRTGQSTVTVRSISAENAGEARSIGALQNIAEGRGTAVDAAKFMRDSGITLEDLKAKGISLGEATASKGVALSNLSHDLFAKVVNEEMPLERAVTIGEATTDHAEQRAIAELIDKSEAKGKRINNDTLRELIRFVKGSDQKITTTTSLFGEEQVSESLALEKAEISAYIKGQLSRDKRLFGYVSKESRASELERGNNIIDVETSKQVATEAAQGEEIYNKLSNRGGPIADILDDAAKRLAGGENATKVKQQAFDDIRTELSQTLTGGQKSSLGRVQTGAQRDFSVGGKSDKAEYSQRARRGDADWAGGGLTPEQLSAWSKSKSFAVEEYGEQGSLLGAPDKMYRVQRLDADGQIERALVTEKQLQRLIDSGSKNAADALRKSESKLFN